MNAVLAGTMRITLISDIYRNTTVLFSCSAMVWAVMIAVKWQVALSQSIYADIGRIKYNVAIYRCVIDDYDNIRLE